MRSKGQVAGQVFIFILAAFLAILIIGYGYKAVSNFVSKTDKIVFAQFKTDLESNVRNIASSPGDVKKLELKFPSNFEKVCFLDLSYSGKQSAGLCDSTSEDYEPIVCDAWNSSTESNVYLLPKMNNFKIGKLEITGGYLCMKPSRGKIVLRLEGKGDRTKVEKWE